MPKRARKLQKQRRKNNVKRNAKKIKEITVQDILMNPDILNSTAFKSLPVEKQNQLIQEAKQYLNAKKTNQIQPVTVLGGGGGGGGGVNHDLYSQLLQSQQLVAKRENEAAAYKQQIEANKAQASELAQTKKQLSDLETKYQQELSHKQEVELLKNQIYLIKDKMDNGEIQDLRTQLADAREKNRYAELKRNEIEKVKIIEQLKPYSIYAGTPTKTNPLNALSSPSERLQRDIIERNIQANDLSNALQSSLAYQSQSLKDNGDIVNATIANNNLEEVLKKKSLNELNDTSQNNFTTLDNQEVKAIQNVTALETSNTKDQQLLEKLQEKDKLTKEILNNANADNNKPLSPMSKSGLQLNALHSLKDLQDTAGEQLNPDFTTIYMQAIDEFNSSHDLKKLVKVSNFNQKMAEEYNNNVEQLNALKDEGNKLLLELSSDYSNFVTNGRDNLEKIKMKLTFTNDIYEAKHIVSLIARAHEATSHKDLHTLGEINNELTKPIVHKDKQTVYAEDTTFSPFKEPYEALNQPALKNMEVCKLSDIDITQDVDISKIKNRIIMDNVDLKDLLKYWDKTDNRYKFVAGLIWKIDKALLSWGFGTVKAITGVLFVEGTRIMLKNTFAGATGAFLGTYIASKIPVTVDGKQSNVLAEATKTTANTIVDGAKTILSGAYDGIAESKLGQFTKETANNIVDKWRKGKSWLGFKPKS